MRYDQRVRFTIEKDEYNPSIGESVTDISEKIEVMVNMTDASQQVMQVAFGEVKQGSKVVRLLGHLQFDPSHMTQGNVKYKVAMKRILRNKTTFVLEEVNASE